jgi:hypothetical protein
MKSLGMPYGPYPFSMDNLRRAIAANQLGNYALGYMKDSTFYPTYVGRSDIDLQAEIAARLPPASTHTHFKFGYAPNAREAFTLECQNYHEFIDELENEIHPDKPEGENYACPVCGQ